MKVNISLKEQLIKYGYFSEQIPPCFTSEKYYEKFDNLTSSASKKDSECYSITIAKNDSSRRNIKIPNPEHQLVLIDYMIKNIIEIEKIILNEHSQSNPFVESVGYEEKTIYLDIPRLKDVFSSKSLYIKNLEDKIRRAMGYKYLYKLDLASFYDNIYTHVIEWAVVGRDVAKEHSQPGNLGEKLDQYVRNTNSKETSGIPTGPFTSRIISEIILKKIDEDLHGISKEHGFKFFHYVDDYEFYFKNEADYNKSIIPIRTVFDGYRLKINELKTDFKRYPFYKNQDIKTEYRNIFRKKGKLNSNELMLAFFKADEFFQKGEKGAYKYLLKILVKTEISHIWMYAEPFLLGIILLKPELAQYVMNIILVNKNFVSTEFKVEMKKCLLDCTNNQFHNEAGWIFWLLRKIDYDFSIGELVELIQKTKDDLLLILIFDYIKFKKIKIEKDIEKCIKNIHSNMVKENIYGEHWLLLYEWYLNKWYKYKDFKDIVDIGFFAKMKKEKVSFFNFNN